MTPETVHVHVASFNTASATELCIRSMRRLAGMPLRVSVGDSGSHDRSIKMLRRFERRGLCDVEVASGGRRHSDWLDQWYAACTERYCVFSDSDVEYLRAGWLEQMVDTARAHGAALVATRIQARDGETQYRHPTTGATRILAPRPEPWLMLIDTQLTAGRVPVGFAYEDRLRDDGTKVAYDVGAAFFDALDEAGLPWVEMPPDFGGAYRHFGGLSWQRALGRGVPLRTRGKQLAKRGYVWLRLQRARVIDQTKKRR